MFRTSLTALLLLAAANAYAAPAPRLPRDVEEFFFRQDACDYFWGEPRGGEGEEGAHREKFLDQRLKELRCDDLEKDRASIVKKYLCSQTPSTGFYCPTP